MIVLPLLISSNSTNGQVYDVVLDVVVVVGFVPNDDDDPLWHDIVVGFLCGSKSMKKIQNKSNASSETLQTSGNLRFGTNSDVK